MPAEIEGIMEQAEGGWGGRDGGLGDEMTARMGMRRDGSLKDELRHGGEDGREVQDARCSDRRTEGQEEGRGIK